jgi:hypothetical protein
MSRLARVLLALAVAFVVTARTEAAAEHCRKLAETEAAAPVTETEAAPCHGEGKASAPRPVHHPNPASPEDCECLAVLTGYVSIATALSSAHIEPYVWARPQGVAFASVEPAPDWRPPRA